MAWGFGYAETDREMIAYGRQSIDSEDIVAVADVLGGGMGARMMRYIMNKKNIDSLESLRTQAIQNGVEFIACQMSMDVMGVKREELLDHVTIGGVATYMNRAEQANVNLFI